MIGTRKRRRPYNPCSHRLRELERLIAARHGRALDTDDAGLYLIHVAQTIRRMRPGADDDDIRFHLKNWTARCIPLIPDEVIDQSAEEAIQNPWMLKADALANQLRVTNGERQVLDLRTIGACDVSKAARAKARKQRKRLRDRRQKAAERLELGMQPRAQYLAESLSRTQPWKAEGISRSTWERRRRQKIKNINVTNGQDDVTQVCRPIDRLTRDDRLASHPAKSLNLHSRSFRKQERCLLRGENGHWPILQNSARADDPPMVIGWTFDSPPEPIYAR